MVHFLALALAFAQPGEAEAEVPAVGVEATLAAGLERLRLALPIVSGPLTLNRAEQNGAELILYGTFSTDVTEAEWAEIEEMLPDRQCLSMASLIERGAVVTYRLSDTTGERRQLQVSSCPHAPGV